MTTDVSGPPLSFDSEDKCIIIMSTCYYNVCMQVWIYTYILFNSPLTEARIHNKMVAVVRADNRPGGLPRLL